MFFLFGGKKTLPSAPPHSNEGANGRVAEWFKAAVLKTAVGASPPWVRIPPLPPIYSR